MSSALLQNELKIVPLTATGPKVYVATMIAILSGLYVSLDETLNHMKSIKLKDRTGENDADYCDEIWVGDERLDSVVTF